MTVHIMLDLETWGTDPGNDLRSIGACVFDPVSGMVADGLPAIGTALSVPAFYIATDNPFDPPQNPRWIREDNPYAGNIPRRYPLTRNPDTVKWWSKQSAEAQAAFDNPVDLRKALMLFGKWLHTVADREPYTPCAEYVPCARVRMWSHGSHFDTPILAAAYQAVGLAQPWHYRSPRDTRTVLEAAGIDPHRGLEPFSTGTYHHALDDAICQARAVCHAYSRIKVIDQ